MKINDISGGNNYSRFYELVPLVWWKRMINNLFKKQIFKPNIKAIPPLSDMFMESIKDGEKLNHKLQQELKKYGDHNA